MQFSYNGIFGMDISHWQDVNATPQGVNFVKMRDYGARFVIIRAGNGLTVDSDFVTNWKNAKGVLPRASYWFYNNLVAPKTQAGKYRDTIEGDMEGLCFLDLEDRTSGAYMGWRAWYDFIENFKSFLPGVKIGIYSGHYYFEEFTMNATDAQREYFKQFPLWLASYTQDPFKPNYAAIRIPRPFTHCVLLQSGTPAIGLAAGVESLEIDYNQFSGDETEFAKYFMDGEPIPPPEPGEDMTITFTGKVKATAAAPANVRAQADTSATVVANLAPGITFTAQGVKVANDGWDWLNIVTPTLGWLALTTNIEYQAVTPAPTERTITGATVRFTDGTTQELIVKP